MANGLLGLLSPQEQAYARNQGLLGLGSGLLAGSGYRARPVTFGEAAGGGVANMQQMQQQAIQNALQRQTLQQRMGGVTPSAVNEFQFWQGLQPEQQEQFLQLKRAPTFLDVGSGFVTPSGVQPTQPRPVVGKELPPAQRPEVKRAQAEEQARGKLVVEKEKMLPKARASMRALHTKSRLLKDKVQEGLQLVGPFTTGAGSLLAALPGTDARRLKGVIRTIQANLGFSELQQMRSNSPTGGALGSISEREIGLLTSVQQALDQAQSASDVVDALNIINEYANRMEGESVTAFEEDFGMPFSGQRQTPQTPETPPLPEGFTIR